MIVQLFPSPRSKDWGVVAVFLYDNNYKAPKIIWLLDSKEYSNTLQEYSMSFLFSYCDYLFGEFSFIFSNFAYLFYTLKWCKRKWNKAWKIVSTVLFSISYFWDIIIVFIQDYPIFFLVKLKISFYVSIESIILYLCHCYE
jgi:hypothetical protein